MSRPKFRPLNEQEIARKWWRSLSNKEKNAMNRMAARKLRRSVGWWECNLVARGKL